MEIFRKYKKMILIWLWIGLSMVFIQIIIGGITRLTDSGLSITEWEVIKGVVPPISEIQWEEAFTKYKIHAKKQYETLHSDMTLSEFKWIYFWEWFHRLWARTMGIVFIIPFFIFLSLKALPGSLIRQLVYIFISAGMAAALGWIMVASGLGDDTRTWVSAYKLISHLIIAVLTFSLIYWTILEIENWELSASSVQNTSIQNHYKWMIYISILYIIQLLLGGLMAGMRAGLLHPYWPFFIHGNQLISSMLDINSIHVTGFIDYEPSIFIKSWVQLLHRMIAYMLAGGIIYIGWKYFKNIFISVSDQVSIVNKTLLRRLKSSHIWAIITVGIQLLLGILTVINSFGSIPVVLGLLHQVMAIILLIFIIKMLFFYRKLNIFYVTCFSPLFIAQDYLLGSTIF